MGRLYIALIALAGCGRIEFDPVGGPGSIQTPPGTPLIAAGDEFTCTLRSDHSAWCWGISADRQLGADSLVAQPRPVPIAAFAGIELTAISAGGLSACAIDAAGSVWCWGDNSRRQLGQASTQLEPLPVRVAALPLPALEVSVGVRHACAVLADASAWCWGDNAWGELGLDPNGGTVGPPTQILTGVAKIAAGQIHTCALHDDGAVSCWGSNLYGSLGDDTGDHFAPHAIPGLAATAIACGPHHMCALVDGGRYTCWGGNSDDNLGDPSFTDASRATPGPPSAETGFVALTIGYQHTCGILADGSVECWGNNDVGQLADGTQYVNAIPRDTSVTNAIGIAAGGDHTCALRGDDSIMCWGRGSSGELGDGHIDEWSPQRVALPAQASAVGAGGAHACAVVGVAGDVYCWGTNEALQLGSSTGLTDYVVPSPIAVPGVTGATAVSAGTDHACAIVGGNVMCWGNNTSGQLGRGTATYAEAPAMMMGLPSPATKLSAGQEMTCAIANNQVWCVGRDNYGQLGDGGGADRALPVMSVAGTFAEVSAGVFDVCAIDSSNSLSCWGYNGDGEVGNGMSAQQIALPGPVSGAGQYSLVAAGGVHACASLVSGQLQCWGVNTNGQLGTGTYNSHTAPTATVLASPPTAIAARDSVSCAISPAGLQCWGDNSRGSLGDGNTIDSPAPVTVPMSASAISVGRNFACAIDAAGSVYCWGNNVFGQIGNGKVSRSLVPVTVQFP